VLAVLAFAGDASAQELTPPRVIHLPPIAVDAERVAPEVLEVIVRIDELGVATLEACDADAWLCEGAAAALAGAELEPATRDGEPIAARVGIRLSIARDTDGDPDDGDPNDGDPNTDDDTNTRDATTRDTNTRDATTRDTNTRDATTANDVTFTPPPPPDVAYGADARVEVPAGRPRRLELEEVRLMPGALGDPFRAIIALPSVQPVFSGFPLVYVRGAPPAGTVYFYDGVPLPTLFHLGLGPAVVHPTMVGTVQLHAGVAPARYGRSIGGVIVGEGPAPPDPGVHGEVELRTLDVQGALTAPVGDGHLRLAGRYGYPGLLLGVFEPDITLAYWDYQLRFDQDLDARTRVEVVGLGSFDRFGDRSDPEDESQVTLQFHRLELRILRDHGRGELAAALRGSYQESDLDGDLVATIGTLAPRFWGTWKRGPWSLRVGGDLIALAGTIDDTFGDDASSDIALFGPYQQSTAGLYGEATWRTDRFAVELGLRSDVWIAGDVLELSADPRLRLSATPREELTLHVAAGLTHQPAIPPFPLPGISDILVEPGLQRAIQSELGAELELGAMTFSLQGYVHRIQDAFFADAFLLGECPDTLEGCDRIADLRSQVWSYGMEVFLRRDPSETVSGFLAYTLSKASIDEDDQLFAYTPSFDFRHGLDAVLQVRHHSGFFVGGRVHLRTGRPVPIGYSVDRENLRLERVEERLPTFFRADASVGYLWRPRWGRMRIVLEWLNVTLSKEPVSTDCQPDGVYTERCAVEFVPALWAPNLAIHAAF